VNAGGRGSGVQPPEAIEFPCRYEIKAIGRRSARFDALVQGVVTRYLGSQDLLLVQSRTSSGGNYVSITCVIRAHSREQVDAIYAELGRRPEVLFSV
jgi:putative lipoic acid-binding regulatory protein